MRTTASYRGNPWFRPLLILTVQLILFVPLCAAGAQDRIRLTELFDQPVNDVKNNEIGDIEDIVFRRTGQVQSVLISLSGFLGLEDKLIAVPFRKLDAGEKGAYHVGYSREQLENRTEFDYNQPHLYTSMNIYPPPVQGPDSSNSFAGSGRTGRDPQSLNQSDTPKNQGKPEHRPGPDPYYRNMEPSRQWHDSFWQRVFYPTKFLGSALLGRVVFNQQGRQLAEIKDLLIQSIDGRAEVAQIILRQEGLFETEEKLAQVPYRSLSVNNFGILYPTQAEKLD
jgi:sporulation protein YlmC with PRC-barrel domain